MTETGRRLLDELTAANEHSAREIVEAALPAIEAEAAPAPQPATPPLDVACRCGHERAMHDPRCLGTVTLAGLPGTAHRPEYGRCPCREYEPAPRDKEFSGPHLHRFCQACSWEWADKPLDARLAELRS